MPALYKCGVDVSLSEQPERTDASREVVLVCDRCARVQDGPAEDASEEKWTEPTRYLAVQRLSYTDVWWSHTICQECASVR